MRRQIVAVGLGFGLLLLVSGRVSAEGQSNQDASPVLVNTCLITDHVKDMISFYESVLERKAKKTGETYAEFRTERGVLAIFSGAAQENYVPGSAQAGSNRSVIVEFQVADVDAEYRRLQPLVKTWVKPPTTQPWGTRSIYFRDPDGNLIDFFTPAAKQ